MMNPQEIQQQDGRKTIWEGTLEWIEKLKPLNEPKAPKILPCTVSTTDKSGQLELNSKLWSNKLTMQLIPKNYVNGLFLKTVTNYKFHPTPCEALDILIKYMMYGFVGYIQLNNAQALFNLGVKVLILLYSSDCEFIGFIPNDEAAFLNQLPISLQNRISSLGLIFRGLSPREAIQVIQTREQQKQQQRKLQAMRTNIRPMMTVSDAPNFKFIPQPHQGQYSFSKNSIQNSMASIVSPTQHSPRYRVSSQISGSSSYRPNMNQSILRRPNFNDPPYVSGIFGPIQSVTEPFQFIRQPRVTYHEEDSVSRNARGRAEHCRTNYKHNFNMKTED